MPPEYRRLERGRAPAPPAFLQVRGVLPFLGPDLPTEHEPGRWYVRQEAIEWTQGNGAKRWSQHIMFLPECELGREPELDFVL